MASSRAPERTDTRRIDAMDAHGRLDDRERVVDEPERLRLLAHLATAADAPAGGDGGMELRSDYRSAFGNLLGHDFGRVRIHADAEAARSARARGTRAFTVGNVIRFGASQYRPDTPWGRRLIGHELAHVAQQARGGPNPDAEARASFAAERVLRGEAVSASDLGGAAPMRAQHDDGPGSADQPAALSTRGTGLDHFTTDRAALTKEHIASIDQLAWSIGLHLGMLRAGRAAIHIVGHTDTTGTEKHNTGLGQGRADAVRAELSEALKRNRVPEAQVDPPTTASAGESDLAVPTGDNVAEPRNRRVHVEVTITATVPASEKPAVDLNLPPGWEPPLPPDGPGPRKTPGAPPPTPAPAPAPSRSWLEEALRRDELLKTLPDWAREKAIDGLKDMDETVVDKVIDAVPWDDKEKAAAKAALKALLKTLKGQRFKPPEPPPRGPEFGPGPTFPKAPGEKIFKLPPIRFNWP